jgi:NhaP-type Na+/H+ or K+/H+ antiporter
LLLVSTQLDIAHTPQYQEFFATVVLTILGSIFLHGASARLLTNSDAYARD